MTSFELCAARPALGSYDVWCWLLQWYLVHGTLDLASSSAADAIGVIAGLSILLPTHQHIVCATYMHTGSSIVISCALPICSLAAGGCGV